jgi:hypothetical protein
MGHEARTADSFVDHLRRHRHLHRALIFANTASVHRADHPAADQSGRDEVETFGRLFAGKALLTAAVAAGLIGRFQAGAPPPPRGDRARVCAPASWRCLFDVGIHNDILGRGRLRVVQHFVNQRQLAILDRQLLGALAEEAVFEQALFSRHRPQENDGFLERRRGWIGDSGHVKSVSILLPKRPVFIGDN